MMTWNESGYSLYLASGSPRRKALLTYLLPSFDILLPNIPEVQQENESPQDYVARLSKEKAEAGMALLNSPSHAHLSASHPLTTPLVLGADTIVVIDGDILEKPMDEQHAQTMLGRLSGRQHQVMTSVSLISPQRQRTCTVVTSVWFKALTEQEIHAYWLTGEPADKAGSYGIQGLGGRFVTRIDGSFHAVMGLPLVETEQLITEFIKEKE